MKKTLLLVISLFLCILTACGIAETAVEETPAAAEEFVAEVTEEVTTEEVEEVVEETTLGYADEEMPEVIQEEFNQDIAMMKVERAIDCYRQLLLTHDEATWNIIDSIEHFGPYKEYLDLETKDNYLVYDEEGGIITDIPVAAMGTVYYEYSNGISDEVPAMSEYISSKNLDEILNAYNYKSCADTGVDPDKTMMFVGMLLMNYLNQASDIKASNFEKLEQPLWTVNDKYDIVYKLSLLVDDDDAGLVAYFDDNGMLLQFEVEGEGDINLDKFLLKTFPEE